MPRLPFASSPGRDHRRHRCASDVPRSATRSAKDGGPPSALRMTGGAALATDLSRAVKKPLAARCRDGYGMSEVGGGITLTPVAMCPAAVGRPRLAGQRAAHRRFATRAPLPVGHPGEVMVRSPSVMRGYRGDDEATRAVVDPTAGCSRVTSATSIRTGTSSSSTEEGPRHPLGISVYPREVEEVLCACPGWWKRRWWASPMTTTAKKSSRWSSPRRAAT